MSSRKPTSEEAAGAPEVRAASTAEKVTTPSWESAMANVRGAAAVACATAPESTNPPCTTAVEVAAEGEARAASSAEEAAVDSEAGSASPAEEAAVVFEERPVNSVEEVAVEDGAWAAGLKAKRAAEARLVQVEVEA